MAQEIRNKLKPLVAEFGTYHTAFCDPQQQPKQLDAVLKVLPKGARVTHRRLISEEVFRGDATLRASNVQSSDGGGLSQTVCEGVEACETVEVCSIGVPGDPIEFLSKAVEAGHPRSLESHLDTVVEAVVMKTSTVIFRNWQRDDSSSSASGTTGPSLLTKMVKPC